MNLVVSQALATGLAVIATRHSGLPEQVIDGSSGFLVDERDYQALAERILTLSNRPELLAEFGAAGRVHVDDHYNAESSIETQLTAYLELIGVPSERSGSI